MTDSLEIEAPSLSVTRSYVGTVGAGPWREQYLSDTGNPVKSKFLTLRM